MNVHISLVPYLLLLDLVLEAHDAARQVHAVTATRQALTTHTQKYTHKDASLDPHVDAD
jgi:hypothetical protein